ncbi:MAG TPA: hypothetical protein VFB27_01695 [Opitutaceae bacterium]|nr:hypothetical protein [Opitutaceae bacterium]
MKTLPFLHFRAPAVAVCAWFIATSLASAQPTPIEPDLAGLVAGQGWKVANCTVTAIEKDGKPAVHFDNNNGSTGIARLENVTFDDGVIEFDARGQNVVQRSFLGVAFHGMDDTNYDVIYFRPFNFQAADPERRLHAVQYVSHPAYGWKKLRTEHPGEYEKPIVPAPDPDGWFHARIVVAWPKVSVFVDGARDPSLVVDQLNDHRRGWIGLWVDIAGGDFANLKITPVAPP